MMTGPEHYEEAERLLATVKGTGYGDEMARDRLAAAQVHATLALAAATALGAPVDREADSGLPPEDARAWYFAAGTKPVPDEDHTDEAFSASELYEMDQADEAALDAAADAPEGGAR
jgi:hypothetical protein